MEFKTGDRVVLIQKLPDNFACPNCHILGSIGTVEISDYQAWRDALHIRTDNCNCENMQHHGQCVTYLKQLNGYDKLYSQWKLYREPIVNSHPLKRFELLDIE